MTLGRRWLLVGRLVLGSFQYEILEERRSISLPVTGADNFKTVGGGMPQRAFLQNVVHDSYWAYLHPSPELWSGSWADNGVWSNHSWKHRVTGCVRTFNPNLGFNAKCSHWCLVHLRVSTLHSIRSSGWARLKALTTRRCAVARTQLQSCAWM